MGEIRFFMEESTVAVDPTPSIKGSCAKNAPPLHQLNPYWRKWELYRNID
ncbi:uncharacterized protein METZ01_LOCUS285821 [marine metagenome]|uniref:Uncharacterized protein n=1 Tax=marine metagenome TaxID=408172 RepID=A0A382LCY0_9ZZZZ